MLQMMQRWASALSHLPLPHVFPVRSFRQISTRNDLDRWADRHPRFRHPSSGFNGDLLRIRIVAELFRAAGCTAFVETGTHRGSTAVLAARLLECRVFTCELLGSSFMMAWTRCLPFSGIRTYRADSRSFLRSLPPRLGAGAVPMFYLDAHWYEDCPLDEEFRTIQEQWKRFVVVIDDFQVPRKPGFGFDSYGGRPLAIESLESIVEPRINRPPSAYFPGYDPREEYGLRRGYVVLVGGLEDRMAPYRSRFPLDLLEPRPLRSRA